MLSAVATSVVGAPIADAASVYAAYLHNVQFADLPNDVIAATKRSIFDTLGVMLAGSGPETAANRLVHEVARWGGTPEASVVGHSIRLPAVHAGFVNGAMAHQYDFDDTHDAAVAHPTANTLAAGLAVAQSIGSVSGAELIRAIALGSDIVCRLGLAIRGSLYEYPWTRPPIIGIWGATAAASALLKLPADAIESAFGLTLHQTGNTLECLYATGSEVRGLRDGFSVRNGITSALMARAGIRGDRTALEGRFGLFQAFFRGEYDRSALVDDLGRRFEGANVSIKPWPSARETHATIRCVLELKARHGLSAEAVDDVHLFVGRTNLEFCEPAAARRKPAAKMDALSSLPYAVAVALHHGGVPLSAYTSDALGDPAVLALAQRVTWEVDDQRSHDGTIEGARVVITLADGRKLSHSVRHGLGHPDDPLPEEALVRKFRDCARMATRPIGDDAIERLRRIVQDLEHRSVDDLAAALPN